MWVDVRVAENRILGLSPFQGGLGDGLRPGFEFGERGVETGEHCAALRAISPLQVIDRARRAISESGELDDGQTGALTASAKGGVRRVTTCVGFSFVLYHIFNVPVPPDGQGVKTGDSRATPAQTPMQIAWAFVK
jgi:hypothetical protein